MTSEPGLKYMNKLIVQSSGLTTPAEAEDSTLIPPAFDILARL